MRCSEAPEAALLLLLLLHEKACNALPINRVTVTLPKQCNWSDKQIYTVADFCLCFYSGFAFPPFCRH